MKKIIASLFVFVMLFETAHAQQKVNKADLEELKNRMEGIFDSKEQADADASYYNIVLHIKQIWGTKKNKGGYWLYMEQAVASSPDKPYSQRIFHLMLKDDKTIVSQVYEIHEPLRFAGGWNDMSKLKPLTKDSLIGREGCALYIQKDENGNFHGSTSGKDCGSTLRGAAYSTSEVYIYPNLLISWDRGYDKADKQVWGAEQGGYRFRKFTMSRAEEEE